MDHGRKGERSTIAGAAPTTPLELPLVRPKPATRRQLIGQAAGGLGLLLLAGCGTKLQLQAERGEVFTPGAARVLVRGIDENLIHVQVDNQTGYPLAVYRDSFLLRTPTGMRSRLAGGRANVYVINPGGRHDVKLRYDLSGLSRGDEVALVFETGLVVNGQSLPIAALPLRVR
jgi:hypothetical protein